MRRQSLRPIARRALATQSDERLVGLVRDGHEPAFEEIVRRYRGPLVAFATAIVSHHRAEDVVQGALTKAHSALLAEPREIALRPWLFTIVRNASLNVIRDEPQTDELPADLTMSTSPAAIAEQHEELERLVLAICALPSGQREALVRRELEGVGHADIAAQLGTSATAVRGLIFRARTSLRDAIGALVPLPLLRQLLLDGSRAGTAAEAATGGAGIGAAIIGAAGAKGGVAVTAAVLALATGVAIERHQGDRSEQASAQVREAATRTSPTAPADRAGGSSGLAGAATTADGAASAGAQLRSAVRSAGSSGGGTSFVPNGTADDSSGSGPSVSDSGSGSGSGDDGDGGSTSSGSAGPSGDDGREDSGDDGATSQPPVNDDDGHDGPGPSGSGESEPPPPTGGSGSGGSSGPGPSGSEGATLSPVPLLPPPPEDDGHSGSGGGGETTTTIDDD